MRVIREVTPESARIIMGRRQRYVRLKTADLKTRVYQRFKSALAFRKVPTRLTSIKRCIVLPSLNALRFSIRLYYEGS